jgi:hypothetical protein
VVNVGGKSEVIHTTQHHLLWVSGTKMWIEAGSVRHGQQLSSEDGLSVTVLDVQTWTGQQAMYNLTVSQMHTYYVMVGNVPVLVHNEGDTPDPSSLKKLSDSEVKRIVGDVHDFKKEVLEGGGKVSTYDVYVDTKTGNLYLISKDGRAVIPTYTNRGGGWVGDHC